MRMRLLTARLPLIRLPLIALALILNLLMDSAARPEEAPDAATATALCRIRDAGLNDDWAYRRLADLCDKIGARMSGSRQADAAVEQIAAALRQAQCRSFDPGRCAARG